MYILDFIINKYSLYEVPTRSSKLEENDFDFESTDEIFKKSSIRKNDASNTPYEEGRKTEPQLKEFFKDVEDGEWSMDQEQGIETTTEQKKLKKGTKITEEQKFPIQNYNNKKYSNNYNKEENVKLDIKEQSDEEESE